MTIVELSDNAYNRTTKILGFIFVIFSLYILMLSKNADVFAQSPVVTYLSISGTIFSLLYLISAFLFNKTIVSLGFLTLTITVLGSFQQMNISLIYVIPVFLSYYVYSRRTVYIFLCFNVFSFVLSKIMKCYLIYITNGQMMNFTMMLLSSILVALIEAGIFLFVVIPIFRFLIHKNEKLTKILFEKNEFANDVKDVYETVLGYHDRFLTEHNSNVARLTKIILDGYVGKGYSLSADYMRMVIESIKFHDMGKISVDPTILNKATKRTEREMDIYRKHPILSEVLINKLPKGVLDDESMIIVRNVASQHHERLDGSGFPQGLKGHKISLEARIVMVADEADSLLCWRPYKVSAPWDRLVQHFEQEKAGFDEKIVEILLENRSKVLEIYHRR